MRKESSTNFINEKDIHKKCSMALTISLLGGRWKPTILWQLKAQFLSYTDLKNKVTGATERMLVKQLQELERDGLITKQQTATKKIYALTTAGESLIPLLQMMEKWGDTYKAENASRVE